MIYYIVHIRNVNNTLTFKSWPEAQNLCVRIFKRKPKSLKLKKKYFTFYVINMKYIEG